MIDARIPLGYTGGFDAGQAIERAQAMKLRDMAMEQQREEFDFRKQQAAAQTATSQREAQLKQAQTLAKLANAATPENWQNVRQAAASLGVDPSALPEQFDQGWLEQQKLILGMATNPEEMTAFQQELAGAGIKPGSPEYAAFIRQKYAAPKYVVDQGYGYTVIDPLGQTPPQQSAPPPPPAGFVLDGEGAGSNVSGGFPGN